MYDRMRGIVNDFILPVGCIWEQKSKRIFGQKDIINELITLKNLEHFVGDESGLNDI